MPNSQVATSPRVSAHRPAPVALPHDPLTAAAAVVAHINGSEVIDRAAAIEGMALRLERLRDAGPDISRYELEAHLPVLNALFLRFSAEAVNAGHSEHRAKLAKIAFSAHAAYARAVALLAGMQQANRNPQVVLEADS